MLKTASLSVVAYGKADDKLFDYIVPEGINAKVGSVVQVNFGKQSSLGIVRELVSKVSQLDPPRKLVEISSELLATPLPSYTLKLTSWMVEYYASSPRAVWRTLLPSGLSQKSRLKAPSEDGLPVKPPKIVLNSEQQAAFDAISRGDNRGYLLHGITGSGKTEVYIKLVEQQIKLGKSSILLVPEISLTPQMTERLKLHFDGKLVVNHSKLSPANRKRIWLDTLESSEPKVILGPRSSLFMPVKNLGLVVVDEEHESSYKQENSPTYNVNQVVAKICELTGAHYVLGSATPSLQTYWLSRQGKISYLQLTKRAKEAELPPVAIEDLRDQSGMLSPNLVRAMQNALGQHNQVLLLLNRRGSASAMLCRHCGEIVRCPRCDMSLTFHGDLARLVCHYCNYRQLPPTSCPVCEHHDMGFVGSGTKKVEDAINGLFPNHQVGRLDSDNANLSHIEDVFSQLKDGQLDILIGTQMIARGLDLPNVTLVGVVSTESMLAIPDFSSNERTFQLLTQVAGRAGRGLAAGSVIIQTLSPKHPAILAASDHSFEEFYKSEIELREAHAYPPFVYLLKLVYGHSNPERADKVSQQLAEQLRSNYKDVLVLGPAERLVRRVAGKHQRQIVVKAKNRKVLLNIARDLGSDWKFDIDPINLT